MSVPAPSTATATVTAAAATGPTSGTPASSTSRIVIAGAGPAAQALVSQLNRARFRGTVTVLSSRDDASAELLDLAALPQVSLRFGQPASFVDAGTRTVSTADGMEFGYDHLVIATGSAPAEAPVEGAGHCLSYSTIDDAGTLGAAVRDLTTELGRRPLGILVGTGTAAGQAEAVLRARGVRPVRTTLRPAAVQPPASGPGPNASGIVFADGSSMNGDLVVLAEERVPRDGLAASAGLRTASGGGIAISQDFRTSVPGIWAVGDAATFDGVRLGLLVAAASAAGACAAQLMTAASAPPALQAAA